MPRKTSLILFLCPPQAATVARRQAEADLQLLENRVHHLMVNDLARSPCPPSLSHAPIRLPSPSPSPQRDEQRAQKRIEETRKRAQEIRRLKKRNAAKVKRAELVPPQFATPYTPSPPSSLSMVATDEATHSKAARARADAAHQ